MNKSEGEQIHQAMCHSLDEDGNTLAPSKTYWTLTQEEKIIYLEWRDGVLCDEFNEEMRAFDEMMHPLRPHNDMKRFPRDTDKGIGCPTFYDGCNCRPDHNQEDWNDLLSLLERVDAAIEEAMPAGATYPSCVICRGEIAHTDNCIVTEIRKKINKI